MAVMPSYLPLATIAIGSLSLSASLFWLLVGLALCGVEAILPTAFTAFTMGISALMIAVIAILIPEAIGVQVMLWLALSVALVYLSHRFLPHRDRQKLLDRTEAEALTEILPGQTGRVMYEGASWRAKSADESITIQPHQPLYVIGREGTTLIVIAQNLLN
jgi:membrane protein implicated in regulation of membrane protease activity